MQKYARYTGAVMRYHKSLQKHYDLSEKDIENLLYIQPNMEKYRQEFLDDYLDAAKSKFHLTGEQIAALEANSDKMEKWYNCLFQGCTANPYYNFLYKQGAGLFKYNFDPDFIPAMISFARLWMHEKVFQTIDDDYRRKGILLSLHKLLDINSEIMLGAYYDKTVSKYSSVFSWRKTIVDFSERFSLVMHSILVLVLMGLTIMSVYIFAQDVIHLLSGHAETMLITALGSLLIIWVLVELLHTEVQIIGGGKFKTSVFISVALIAFIRDLLIITLKHEKGNMFQHGFILTSILVLGLIFWLISHTEGKD
ncbi:phosphate-starvation-inducible PsiE family protein [Deferribacteres bacterium DY0609]|nr:phosphate-starvation-inducible PsiE family protein [Denitrovibrio acetiphilus]